MQGWFKHKAKHKKLNILALFIALITLLLILGVCASGALITKNAIASDEVAPFNNEASPEEATAQETDEAESSPLADNPTNDTVQLSFSFAGLPEGVVPGCELRIGDDTYAYTFGEKINVLAPCSDVNYSNEGSIFEIWFWDVNAINYSFTWFSPKGYDPVSISPSDLTSITENQDFVVAYQKYDGTFQIDYKVNFTSHGGTLSDDPLPGYKLNYYDVNGNLIQSKTTDSNGQCSFTNLTLDQTEGLIVGELEDYSDFYYSVKYTDFNEIHKYFSNISIPSVEDAFLSLHSTSPYHVMFEVCETWYSYTDPTEVIDQTIVKKETLATDIFNFFSGTTWTVREDGSLFSELPRWTIEIKAICENGYVVDHWDFHKPNGDVESYKPGQSFTCEVSYPPPSLNLESFYTEAPPEPAPTPSPDSPSFTAQTEDSTQALIQLVFAVLVASAAITILSRKHPTI